MTVSSYIFTHLHNKIIENTPYTKNPHLGLSSPSVSHSNCAPISLRLHQLPDQPHFPPAAVPRRRDAIMIFSVIFIKDLIRIAEIA